jgi:hypothetical protein
MSYFGIPIRNGVSIGLGALAPLGARGLAAPGLALNFTSGVLDSRVTFTRASTGTYFDSAGALQSAAINAPRFDYNPTTLQPQGLLIEEQRTNLVLNSATLITQSVTVTGVAHTLSFYGTGTVVISGTGTGTLVGSGAFPTRSTLTFTPTAGVVILTVTGTVTQAQLEVGAFATSYIPTTAAAATRAADNAVLATLTPWYNATASTIYTEFKAALTATSGTATSLNDNTSNNQVTTLFNSTSFFAARNTSGAGVISVPSTANAPTTAFNKVALAVANLDAAICGNGGAVATSILYNVPTVTQLELGTQLATSSINGWIKSVAYYPRRFSNAELQALTA